jgi:hypothetical protein
MVGEMKATGRRFGSAAQTRKRVADGGARRGGTGRDSGSSNDQGRRKAPGESVLGQKAKVVWPGFFGNEGKIKTSCRLDWAEIDNEGKWVAKTVFWV